MATLRSARIYRNIDKLPYTRKSKYKKKSYVKMAQRPKITQYNSGNLSHDFSKKVLIISKSSLQLRDNALEAARVVANKFLTETIGDQEFKLILVSYPHQILREHKLATGAGADRFSSGMQKSFGKPIGLAARVFAGQRIFEIHVNEQNLEAAKIAAQKIGKKLGINTMNLVI